MNCTFCCASAGAANAAASATATADKAYFRCMMLSLTWPVPPTGGRASRSFRGGGVASLLGRLCPRGRRFSIRERPHPELLLADRPQPGEAVRLGDEEDHDHGAEQHELDVRNRRSRDANSQPVRQLVEEDRHQDDEDRPEEGTEDRAEAA